MNPSDELKSLHAKYCALTGLPVRYGYHFEQIWFMWHREGYTQEDLEMTINYLKTSQRNRPDLLVPNLRLHKLIGDLGFFEERRAEAEKVRTVKQNAEKQSVLRATGRVAEQPKDAMSVSRILESPEFKDLIKLKESLKTP